MYRIVALTFIVIVGLIVGCSNGNRQAAAGSNVLDVPPAAPRVTSEPLMAATPTPVPAAAPTPVSSTPVAYTATPAAKSTLAMAETTTGGKYTVRKGDTLFSIAKSNYGTGREWKKIVAANPGLEPSKLRVGQEIMIP